jgi:hypothetical protein
VEKGEENDYILEILEFVLDSYSIDRIRNN